MKTCTYCGRENDDLAAVCTGCRMNEFRATPPILSLGNTPPPLPPLLRPGHLTEEEVRAFVGSNAEYYVKKWRPAMEGRTGGVGFNWAAFGLAGFWMPYRKMYAEAAVLWGGLLLFTLAECVGPPLNTRANPSKGIALVVGLVCALGANGWYLARAKRIITRVRSQGLEWESHLQVLAKRGGASPFAALGFLLLGLLLVGGLTTALEQGRMGRSMTFNAGRVYFTGTAHATEAERLGNYLLQINMFDGKPKTVQLRRSGDTLEVRFVVRESARSSPQNIAAFNQLGRDISKTVFHGQPVVIQLCDQYLNPVGNIPNR